MDAHFWPLRLLASLREYVGQQPKLSRNKATHSWFLRLPAPVLWGPRLHHVVISTRYQTARGLRPLIFGSAAAGFLTWVSRSATKILEDFCRAFLDFVAPSFITWVSRPAIYTKILEDYDRASLALAAPGAAPGAITWVSRPAAKIVEDATARFLLEGIDGPK